MLRSTLVERRSSANSRTAKVRAAYQDFLTIWKDADPDIPALIAAKSEYAKLKSRKVLEAAL
jgi:eukaryotic-like serine/threonine-protein kinase